MTPGGQGLEDFETRLRMTPWAWDLRVLLTPGEGPRAWESVSRAVRALSGQVDVIVITRGGGAGVTTAYDSPSVAFAVCQASCPVIVAVGHASDTTVAEQVAWRRESTPTAAAVTLDRVLAAQRDDLAREMAAAFEDAQQLLRRVSEQLEGEWTEFRLDIERYAARTTPTGMLRRARHCRTLGTAERVAADPRHPCAAGRHSRDSHGGGSGMTAAPDALRAAMTRLAELRQQMADGRLASAEISTVYAEATELYLAARRSLERIETDLRVTKERI